MIVFIKSMKQFQYTKFIKHNGIKISSITYGIWGAQSIDYGFISEKHITFIKQYLQKILKKETTFKLKSTINVLYTKKPIETRMGGGKGAIYDKKYFIQPGSIFLEFGNISFPLLVSVLRTINSKLPLKLRLIKFK